MSSATILLQPRPYAQASGKLLLLPLLPLKKPAKYLPAELWYHIFAHAILDDEKATLARSLLIVCKAFKVKSYAPTQQHRLTAHRQEIALPLLYGHVNFIKISAFAKFYGILYAADQKWDSIRRIPYSTPGRWVQTLDLSHLEFAGQAQALSFDSTLTFLFPLVPFLTRLSINPSFVISRRALDALADKDGIGHLRFLEGLSYIPPSSPLTDDDPFVRLFRHCTALQVLELIGQGPEPAELEFLFGKGSGPELSVPFLPLNLSNLHTLTVLSMHSSPLMLALLNSPLPSLKKLTITPYHDIPYPASMTSPFIEIHGKHLRSLNLLTVRSWPTRLHPSPPTLLHSCPKLHHLSLERPLTALRLDTNHPLEILSVPRPDSECWTIVQDLLPKLPALRVIRIRDMRWLRDGISSRAQAAGVQGEMREWARRLGRNGILVLDAGWNGLKC
ncbi:hypothetical protein APHAL10511_005973 [Amanita phalloides]|nr:hypothetical protein APHAL10511_005973 [Amanita phalloides]